MGIQGICPSLISLVSGFRGFKKTDGFTRAVMAYAGHPLFIAFMPRHSSISRRTVFRRWSIFLVFLVGRQTQIAQSVVKFVAIDVINVIASRNVAKHVNPNQSLSSVTFGVNGQDPITRNVLAAGSGAFNHV